MRKHPRRYKVFITGYRAKLTRGKSLGDVYQRELAAFRKRRWIEAGLIQGRNVVGADLLPPYGDNEMPDFSRMIEVRVCRLY